MIQNHSDHGAAKEPMNPWPEWIDSSAGQVQHDPGDLGSLSRSGLSLSNVPRLSEEISTKSIPPI